MLIYAHRGSWENAPQNSAKAMEDAVAIGADGIECDLRMTKDLRVVLCHDPSYLGHEIANTNLSVLSESALGPLGLATLPEALAGVRGVRINLELKPQTANDIGVFVDVVAAEMAKLWSTQEIGERIEISSFQEEIIFHVASSYPSIPRYLLIDRYDAVRARLDRAVELGCIGVNVESLRATERMLGEAGRRRLKVGVWTVDSPRRAKMLSYSSVSHIITNRVEKLNRSLGRYSPR